MSLQALYIVNKAGGLVFHKQWGNGTKQKLNDHLRLASTFHGLHAIAKELTPSMETSSTRSGILNLHSASFQLHALHTLTGVKFFVIATKSAEKLQEWLQKVYKLYASYVLKNPFYELDMPIRCELFSKNLQKAVQSYNDERD